MPNIIASNIDRAITVEMRPERGLPRGVMDRLYEAVRAKLGESPTLAAARSLQELLQKGDVVVLLTGAGDDIHLANGETDGPMGAAAVARGLEMGLGVKPVIVTEQRYIDVQDATCVALGYTRVDNWEVVQRRPYSSHFIALPEDQTQAAEQAQSILDEFDPKAVIAIEKLGPNRKGVYHSITGMDVTAAQGKGHHLFELARETDRLTVGIGDGGNELGFGIIFNEVRAITRNGRECVCPCANGMATSVGADLHIPAAVSNWGAYGLVAMLSFLLRKPEIMHNEEDEKRMLAECVRAGAADGLYGTRTQMVDGISLRTNQAVVSYLRSIVEIGLTSVDRPF